MLMLVVLLYYISQLCFRHQTAKTHMYYQYISCLILCIHTYTQSYQPIDTQRHNEIKRCVVKEHTRYMTLIKFAKSVWSLSYQLFSIVSVNHGLLPGWFVSWFVRFCVTDCKELMADNIIFVTDGNLPSNKLFRRIVFIVLVMYFVGYSQWWS